VVFHGLWDSGGQWRIRYSGERSEGSWVLINFVLPEALSGLTLLAEYKETHGFPEMGSIALNEHTRGEYACLEKERQRESKGRHLA